LPHALARADEPPPRIDPGDVRALAEQPPPLLAAAATREALWRDAGIVRSAEQLSVLLDHEHPLVRLIARCALARTESRGAHLRADHPAREGSFDHRHVTVGDGDGIAWQTWR